MKRVRTDESSSKRSKHSRPTRDDEEICVPRENWVSATATKNFMIKDPLLDWLQLYYNSLPSKTTFSKALKNCFDIRRTPYNFTEFVMQQGQDFERHVIKLLYQKFGSDVIVDLGGDLSPFSDSKFNETIAAVKRGIPIIYNAVLKNKIDKTFGVADLLVRSDWINRLLDDPVLPSEQETSKAPHLTGDYHYIVIDIKFTTLHMRCDGIHLLNKDLIPAYKSQVLIYTNALALIQGYNPQKAYLLGRRWKYTSKGETFKGKSCFEKLGTINYMTEDVSYVEQTKKAIEWVKDVRKNGKDWDILTVPLSRPELYPNMCNTYDSHWRSVKELIADEIKEITCLWMCGVKNRVEAHSHGVYKWTDPQCKTKTLGINGVYTANILSKILTINQRGGTELISPEIIDTNYGDWKRKRILEFFVDFETVTDVCCDMSSLPSVGGLSMIFTIGVGYVSGSSTGDESMWIYQKFTVDSLTLQEENRICTDFSNYIKEIMRKYRCYEEDVLFPHWSHAEPTAWENACEKYFELEISSETNRDITSSRTWVSPKWFDMLKLFKSIPIVVRGCFGFGLKEVAKAMRSHGFIQTHYDEDCLCSDGTIAMLGAYRAHLLAQERDVPLGDIPIVKDIEKYNEVDCKVMMDILTYLREKRC
jgi:hypothetical protein